jgi:hypothetical protein
LWIPAFAVLPYIILNPDSGHKDGYFPTACAYFFHSISACRRIFYPQTFAAILSGIDYLIFARLP